MPRPGRRWKKVHGKNLFSTEQYRNGLTMTVPPARGYDQTISQTLYRCLHDRKTGSPADGPRVEIGTGSVTKPPVLAQLVAEVL